MIAMAKARRRKTATGKAPVPRKVIAQLKASEDFREWFEELLLHVRLPSPIVVEHALLEYAKSHGFDRKAPER